MLYGLKNVRVMYQRLLNKIFNNKIDRNVEIYVDGIIVKSQSFE